MSDPLAYYSVGLRKLIEGKVREVVSHCLVTLREFEEGETRPWRGSLQMTHHLVELRKLIATIFRPSEYSVIYVKMCGG